MANTPNLDLVKPAGTDHALVSVINSNSDKIDTGFGTLSEQIETESIGSGMTVSGLESALTTLVGTMSDYQFKNIRFNISGAGASGVLISAGYLGTLKRYSSTRAIVELQNLENGTASNIIVGQLESDSWSWQKVAMMNTNTFAKVATAGINANSTMYLNHSGSVILMSDRGGMWTEGTVGRALTKISDYENITVTRESSTKLKIVSSVNYSTQLTAFGYGETLSFSST